MHLFYMSTSDTQAREICGLTLISITQAREVTSVTQMDYPMYDSHVGVTHPRIRMSNTVKAP